MKILLNLLAVKSGGQITRAENFIKIVKKKYPHIEILILKQKDYLDEFNLMCYFKIIEINLIKGPLNFVHRYIWENLFLKKIIKENNAEIFLSFSHYVPLKKLGIYSYVGISNLAPFSKLALSYEDLYYKIKFKILSITILTSLRRSDFIIALSKTAKKVLIEKGFSNDKIILSPIGIDNFWKNNNDNFKKIEKKFFLYVSHFYRYKNHENLIDAYQRLPDKIKSCYDLILIGKSINKNYFKKICNKIIKLNLQKNVHIIPGLERKKLKSFYKQCVLFIFPSLVENCPNILLEAMACGCPIATVNIDPMREYCEDSALYFDGTDSESIKKCMEDFINNKNKYSYLPSSSLKRSNYFSWEKFTDQLILNLKKNY